MFSEVGVEFLLVFKGEIEHLVFNTYSKPQLMIGS